MSEYFCESLIPMYWDEIFIENDIIPIRTAVVYTTRINGKKLKYAEFYVLNEIDAAYLKLKYNEIYIFKIKKELKGIKLLYHKILNNVCTIYHQHKMWDNVYTLSHKGRL